MAEGVVLVASDGGSNLQGGGGDDTLVAGHGPDTLTGAGGADVFRFGSVPWTAGEVTDFTPGTDRLDLSALLTSAHYTGSEPISDGFVKLVDNGHGGSWLYFDSDGRGTADPFGSFITTLDHVAPSQVHAADLGVTSPPPPPIGAAKAFVVFAGQSNMGGLNQDPGTLPASWRATPQIQIWNPQIHAWQEMQPGFNTGYGTFTSTWGPEVQFAIDFHTAHPDETLYIVKSVAGGTQLAVNAAGEDWSPQSAGELFDQTTAEIHDAGAALGGAQPTVLFWGQGEEDANSQANATAYGHNLSAFFAAARAQWLDGAKADIGFFRIGSSPPFASQVQAGELSVDQADPNALSFETSDYPLQGDDLHYSTAGLEKVGDQFYQLFSAWTGGGTSPPPPPASPPPAPAPPPPPAAGGQVLTAHDGGSDLVGGAGDDTFIAAHGPDTLTGGAGADRFTFGELPWQPGHITDFSPGTDKLDVSQLLAASHYTGSDPISDGYVKLIDDGHGDTWLYFDTDGHGTADPWGTFVATLDHVAPGAIHASDLVGGAAASPPPPPVSPPPVSPPPPPASPPPPPGAAGVVLTAQPGGSNLVGGPGDDTLNAGTGPDTLTGGGGADHFVFGTVPWTAGQITDFVHGTDRIDISGLLSRAGYAGSDPIADGYLKLLDDGHGDTWLYFDRDGHGTADPWGTFVATIEHVSPAGLALADFIVH
jgi:Ca2+-binding RTX toxin-like protein